MPNTATRLITLIMLQQRQPDQKASELARELGVSVRTIQRYTAMLDEMSIPIYAESGPHGGYSLMRGYKPRCASEPAPSPHNMNPMNKASREEDGE